jgi:transposase
MSKSNRRAAEIGGTGRWSARRKAEAVLRLLKGEDLDTLSRQLKVTAATLSEWRDVFLANGLAGLKSREVDGRDDKIAALEKALAETALDLSVSRAINTAYERRAGPLASGKSTP